MAETLIILPTYNEKENLEELIFEIFKYAPDVDILVVDDNSPDGTGDIAQRIAANDRRVSVLRRNFNRGRGYAGIEAFRESLKRPDVRYIMEMDADFSHHPRYIPAFLEKIKNSDMVIGSRYVKGGTDSERNIFRYFLSKLSNLFIRRYLKVNIRDCSAGYRCFKRRVIASLDMESLISKGPAIIEEILYLATLRNYKITEIPIEFKKRYKGKTKLGLGKLIRVFMDILFFKYLHSSKGLYIKEARKFGFNLALLINIMGCLMYYRANVHFIWFTISGCLILIFAILFPGMLTPLKRVLDFGVLCIRWLVNAVSLTAVFYLIFSPVGILLKVFKKDILNQKIDRNAHSYWIKRDKKEFSARLYERMG